MFWKPTVTTQPTLSPVPPNPVFSGGGGGGKAAILGASCKAGSTSDGSMGKFLGESLVSNGNIHKKGMMPEFCLEDLNALDVTNFFWWVLMESSGMEDDHRAFYF